jgi:arginyl-tRNA synthetase
MVEFVSANPTGPLHLGHGRQAALGDAISSLLDWTGWSVHREFYYNDAGKQIELLAESVWARYQELLGEAVEVPEGGYLGEYVRDVAREVVTAEGERFRGDDSAGALSFMRTFAVRVLREEQDRDLDEFRLSFDRYFLESSLYSDGLVESTIQALEETGLVYERDDALWLRTTEYGDQKDRVMVRGDGNPTYFLPDEYVIHQMVTVQQEGKEVKLSKRAGSYITLRELFSQVGVDVARYFFLMRKPDAHLVFDLDMALDQSEKNPVFKIQYAHARMCSIFRKGEVDESQIRVEDADLDGLSHTLERTLIKRLADFPGTVERAAAARAPHILCDFLEQTSGAVNSWYHAGNPSQSPELAVLVADGSLRQARLALARAVQIVLRNGLEILGVSAPTRMDRSEEEQDA